MSIEKLRKKTLLYKALTIFSVFCLATFPYKSSYAFGNDEIVFADSSSKVSDNELKDIRGGFITKSGAIVDIGLHTVTALNGAVIAQNYMKIEPNVAPDALSTQTLAQITPQNIVVSNLALNSISQVLNVVQNSRNNVVLDNFAILNIDVTNLSRFVAQTQVPLLNHQLVDALR